MRKKIWLMMLVVVMMLTLTACGDGEKNANTNSNSSSSKWEKDSIANVLPYPEKGELDITLDEPENFNALLEELTKQDWEVYLEQIQESGFTIDVEKMGDTYSAYNEEGYKLDLNYYDEILYIDIYPPKEFKKLRWPKSDIAKLLPVPKAKVGVTEWEGSYGFLIYVGETSIDDFNDYVDACEDKGFTVDYQRGDKFYYADNKEGYQLTLRYEGFETMFVKIEEPIDYLEDDMDWEDELDESEEEEDSSDSVDADLKAFLDEYEEFMDGYIKFMDKYQNSSDTLSMMDDYTEMMEKYEKFMEKLEEYDEDEMSAADAAYYLKVMNRVNEKLLESL